ncbi:hypothetical protein HN51_070878 [Arachis hypogaea]
MDKYKNSKAAEPIHWNSTTYRHVTRGMTLGLYQNEFSCPTGTKFLLQKVNSVKRAPMSRIQVTAHKFSSYAN